MKKSRQILLLALCAGVLVLAGCRRNRPHAVNFYYWKSKMQLGQTERDYFHQLGSQRLYLRLFDVDSRGNFATPIGEIQPFKDQASALGATECVPVVFVTNRTFLYVVDESDVRNLARKISGLIDEITHYNHVPKYAEIQIDCDWTRQTRDTYFRFLKALAEVSGKDVTCTLRLHQIKDKQVMGIPPVHKGYLMCYATSDPTEGMTRNSILNIDLLKGYTKNINNYPLAFDVALPLYSWGIVTNHLGKIKLINGLSISDLQTENFKQIDESTFEVQKDCFLHGLYINRGFTIKIEEISPALLNEAKVYLDRKINRDYAIVYFHLSEGFLRRFNVNELK